MVNVAIFASGSGSNAQKVLAHFAESRVADVRVLISNKTDAGALGHAKAAGVEGLTFPSASWKTEPEVILAALLERSIDFIVLAGFLLKVPDIILDAFPERIVNIHPALLPKFGGKGMYGIHVHRAVVDSDEPTSGITIHLVNEHYDEGQILFQASTNLEPNESPESLQTKILLLEHAHFAPEIEKFLLSKSWK